MLPGLYALWHLYSHVPDPFAAVFGNESFGGGFADFTALAKVIEICCSDPSASPTQCWDTPAVLWSETYWIWEIEVVVTHWTHFCGNTSISRKTVNELLSVLWFIGGNSCNTQFLDLTSVFQKCCLCILFYDAVVSEYFCSIFFKLLWFCSSSSMCNFCLFLLYVLDLAWTFCFSQTVLTSLASTIRTCSRKMASLPALMCPQPCPQKRVRQLDHLLHLQVSTCIVRSHCGKVTVVKCRAPRSNVGMHCVKLCWSMLGLSFFILRVYSFSVCLHSHLHMSVCLSVFALSGKRSSLSRTESSDSFQRRGHFLPQLSGDFTSSASSSSLPAKDPIADPFAPSSPPRHNVREADRFASFDKVSTSLSPSPSPSPDSQ